MSVGGSIDTVGDNKEFTLAAIQDVTVYFVSSNTSANDTATEKYFDTSGVVKQICIRTDQTIQIISMDGVTFTDPITVIINKSHTEKFDVPVLTKMIIRPTIAGTNIKIRTRGR